MIKVMCIECGKINSKSPSKVNKRNYCNMQCYSKTRNNELIKIRYRFSKGRPEIPGRIEALKKLAGRNHYAWKGQKVGYRGLHQWIRRKKGKPITCSKCGFKSRKPKIIQWANVDGKYRRNIDDFIALCASCHKIYDLKLNQSILDFQSATQ